MVSARNASPLSRIMIRISARGEKAMLAFCALEASSA